MFNLNTVTFTGTLAQINALLTRPDAAKVLPDFACPILLMTGTEDGWSPEAQHREMADLAQDAELVVIDGAGHFLPVEKPEQTAGIITAWIERKGLSG